MATDPYIPDDIKKRARAGVRSGAWGSASGMATPSFSVGDPFASSMPPRSGVASTAPMVAPPSMADGVRSAVRDTGQAVLGFASGDFLPQRSTVDAGPPVARADNIAPTRDAINAGPPRENFRTAAGGTKTDTIPLPAGVRRYQSDGYAGTPGTNDVIYEGRGAHGERSFSNNQFARTLTGRGAGVNPGLDALAESRGREIGGYVDAQRQRADAEASNAAVAPKNAAEYTDRVKTLADLRNSGRAADDKHTSDVLAAAGQAGTNINNDPGTKVAEGVREAALKSGDTPEKAMERGQLASAKRALDAGQNPDSPSLTPDERAGYTQVRRTLADWINRGNATGAGAIPFNKEGMVVDPDAIDAGEYDISADWKGQSFLKGPPGKDGVRRQVFLDPEAAAQLSPFVTRGQRKKPLVSERR